VLVAALSHGDFRHRLRRLAEMTTRVSTRIPPPLVPRRLVNRASTSARCRARFIAAVKQIVWQVWASPGDLLFAQASWHPGRKSWTLSGVRQCSALPRIMILLMAEGRQGPLSLWTPCQSSKPTLKDLAWQNGLLIANMPEAAGVLSGLGGAMLAQLIASPSVGLWPSKVVDDILDSPLMISQLEQTGRQRLPPATSPAPAPLCPSRRAPALYRPDRSGICGPTISPKP